MNYKIVGEPLPVVICSVEAGETMITESGAMSWMSPNMIKGLAAIAADCSAAAESDAASGRIRTPNLGETAGGLTADVSAEAITARFTEAAGFDAFDMDKFRVNLNVLCSTLSM